MVADRHWYSLTEKDLEETLSFTFKVSKKYEDQPGAWRSGSVRRFSVCGFELTAAEAAMFRGRIGEIAFGAFAMLEPDWKVYGSTAGDPGYDFILPDGITVDVKEWASKYPAPYVRKDKAKADTFVFWRTPDRTFTAGTPVELLGWLNRDQVTSAPLVRAKVSYGNWKNYEPRDPLFGMGEILRGA